MDKLGTAEIVQGDARDLTFLDDDSVDLIVTSPPYWGLRSYRDAGEHYDGQVGSEDTPQRFVDELVGMIDDEWRRVLKPVGSLWLNLGDKYAGSGGGNDNNTGLGFDRGDQSEDSDNRGNPRRYPQAKGNARAKSLFGLPWRVALALIDRGWILRAELVWSKPNSLPESVTDRVRRSHEQWFHLVLNPQYFSAVDEIRAKYSPSSLATYAAGGLPHHTENRPDGDRLRNDGDPENYRGNPLGRLPASVWTIPTDPLLIPEGVREQAAGYPVTSSVATILGYECDCPKPGDIRPSVILDPFGGTGTTAGVARMLGRRGISLDLSADYCKLAEWRIFKSGHFGKTEQRSWADRQSNLI